MEKSRTSFDKWDRSNLKKYLWFNFYFISYAGYFLLFSRFNPLLLLFHFHISEIQIRIDHVQTQESLVLNLTTLILQSLEKRSNTCSFRIMEFNIKTYRLLWRLKQYLSNWSWMDWKRTKRVITIIINFTMGTKIMVIHCWNLSV